jgi:hypothetical protein
VISEALNYAMVFKGASTFLNFYFTYSIEVCVPGSKPHTSWHAKGTPVASNDCMKQQDIGQTVHPAFPQKSTA